jgi:hypothetical protein
MYLSLSGGLSVRAVIYSDAAGLPATLLWQSNEVIVPAGTTQQWVLFTGPALHLSPGTYWLGSLTGGTYSNPHFYTNVPGGGQYLATGDTYADGAATSWGALEGFQAGTMGVYAEYTPDGATTTTVSTTTTTSSTTTLPTTTTTSSTTSSTIP